MVSKVIFKRSSSKSLKQKRRNLLKRSPSKSENKSSSSTFISSINKSFKNCRHSLSNLFSKLCNTRGYRLLRDEHFSSSHHSHLPWLLPTPKPSSEKRTVFLDLDETLVHSTLGPPAPETYDFMVQPRIDGVLTTFYVVKRPGVDYFLEAVASRYEVVVFTAGVKEYASMVVDKLDEKEVVAERLYRDSCRLLEGRFVKDLGGRGRDIRRVVIVDDNPGAYSLQPENAIPVKPFVGDMEDREMYRLAGFFEECVLFEDMRDAVKSCAWDGSVGDDDQLYSVFR